METRFLNAIGEVETTPRPYLESFSTDALRGLSERVAQRRRALKLGNDIRFKTSRTYLQILFHNTVTFFNMVLFGLGVSLVVLGKPVEALITSGVVLANVFISMIQELRAKRKLDQIALLTRPTATVIRDRRKKVVDPAEVVQGDLLLLEPGDQVVADGEVLQSDWMSVDESLLTGEADRVPKAQGDKISSGSFCVAGKGLYRAQQVGSQSLANGLTQDARTYTRRFTPLQREVYLIVRVLMAVVVFFLIMISIRVLLEQTSLLESVQEASVLFGLAPSSLFLMIVVAYAWGAVRIAGKGALVQQANSVESLCNVTVLCLDKTGTLTTNNIQLDRVLMLDHQVTGLADDEVHRMLGEFTRASSSTSRTSEAILRKFKGGENAPIEQVPFSSALGWSAVSFDLDDQPGTYVLGAPEVLGPNLAGALGSDTWEIRDTGQDLGSCMGDLAARGLRLVLFACLPEIVALYDAQNQPHLPTRLVPLCLLVFSDELRPNAVETLKGFKEAGIETKIISGDNPQTVMSLAKQIGLESGDGELHAVSGFDLEGMDENQFKEAALCSQIFGRVSPKTKQRLVKSLRESGHYVAMTGDGVNDVLALKQANLGIAMQSGSQATRNVAGMVLLEDSFSALPEAFSEGQRILNGIQDILRLYLTRILYFALLVAAMGWLGVGSPFTPRQNSLISILTLSIPALALALWARPGPVPRESLTRRLLHFMVPGAITCTAAGLLIFLYFMVITGDLLYARQVLTYTMVVIGLLLFIFVEPPSRIWVSGEELSGDRRPLLLAIGLFLLFIACFAIPQLRELYDLEPLRNPLDYAIVGLVVASWAVVSRIAWRARLLDKYLDVDLGGPRK